jgi:hypothetical protein
MARYKIGRRGRQARPVTKLSAVGITLVFLISSMTFVVLEIPSPARAGGGPDKCFPCPPGEAGCGPDDCSGGGGCNVAPAISHEVASVQSGYRQAWVNWSFNTGQPSFLWYPAGGSDLATPEISVASNLTYASINLNRLVASTTYDYQVSVSASGCTTADKTGTFTTGSAPSGEFVGWVSSMTTNPYQLDAIGSPLSSATVWVNAYCMVETLDQWIGSEYFPTVAYEQVAFTPGTLTSSAGYYVLNFPQVYGYTITATGQYNVAVGVSLSLGSNGVCTTSDTGGADDQWEGQPTTVTNSMDLLEASDESYWNATLWESSTLATPNDYQQFGLPSNQLEWATQGLAFVHTSDVDCGINITNGFTQTIDAYTAGSGESDTQTNESLLTAVPVSDGLASITYDYHTTGIINETGTPTIVNSWSYGAATDPGTNAISEADPLSSPPSGSPIWSYGDPGGTDGWFNGGAFTSTTGYEMQVGVVVGWDGLSIDASVPLEYTTSTGVSSTHEIVCHSLVNPPTHYDYQFYTYIDDSEASEGYAINVHIWYDDECLQGTQGCP